MEVEGIAELPAESNPLTQGLLIYALEGALLGDNQRLITSKQQLEEWARKEGYYLQLQSIFSDGRISSDVRLQAIIQVKNGVEKHWRSKVNSSISSSDKERIRIGLVQTAITEPDRKLAVHVCLTLAKIARFDFPTKWGDAIEQLISAIRSFSGPEYQGSLPFQLRRALLLLLYMIKEIVMVRIGPGKSRLKSYTTELLVLLGSTYFNSFDPSFIQHAISNRDQWPILEAALEQSLLSAKLIRRIIIGLIEQPRSDETVKEFWTKSQPIFQSVLHAIISAATYLDEGTPLAELLRKNLCQLAKIHVSMAKFFPTDFALLQSDQFDTIQLHWHILSLLGQKYAYAAGYPPVTQVSGPVRGFDESRQSLIDKLGLQSIMLLRACIKMVNMSGRGLKYRSPESKKTDEDVADRMREVVFTDAAVVELINHIMMELLLFQPSDMQEWEEDPEEWEKQEELGEDFEVTPRACAERLLLDLSIHFKNLTIQQTMKKLEVVTAPGYSSLLQKEAVYSSLGIAAAYLDSHLNFKSLLESNLIPEIQVNDPQYKILRRRVAILVGKWATIQETNGIRPVYYQVFQYLLKKEDPLNDQVVRVAAGRQLGQAVNAWEYEPQEFMPYASDLLTRMMALVEEIELPETKIMLLNTISIIVKRMGQEITPHAKEIVGMLPRLWEQSGADHHMKQVILALLSSLFDSMKENGAEYHAIILPLIRQTVSPNSEFGSSLMEDTLDLWSTIVNQTPTPASPADVNPDLISLVEKLIPLLDLETEYIERIIEILEGYMTLIPTIIFDRPTFSRILEAFRPKMGTMRATQSGYFTSAMEHALNTAMVLDGAAAVQELVFQMVQTKFFDALIKGLKEAWIAHQTTGPKSKHTSIQGIIETDYLALFSRITWASPELLVEALSKSEAAATVPEKMPNPNNLQGIDATMRWFLEEWISHTEDVGDPSRQKLMIMALTRMLDLSQPFMLHNMQTLMNLWTSIITELTDGNDDKSVDPLVYTAEQLDVAPDEGPASADAIRRKALFAADPVHSVNLMALVKSCLQSFIQRCGGEQGFRDEVLANVDKDVIAGFGALGIL